MKSFSLLRREIKEALSESNFKRPTDIQEIAIPRILKGKNALLIASTGRGKTEAALLPIFHRFLEFREGRKKEKSGINILYITPLRALNRDLLDRMTWWSKELKINIAVRHGDTSQYMRRKQALHPPDMLITTPETLQAILPGSVMKKHLAKVRFVVVDEIHELAEDKRGAQLSLALERLSELIARAGGNPNFQRIALSATIGSPKLVSLFLSKNVPIEILKVSASREMELWVERPKPERGDKRIAERTFSSLEASARLRRMTELVKEHNSTLIFVNTRAMAETLASRFRMLGESAAIHHSSLSQEVRIAAEKEFKEEQHKALICTSSLELGIDIGSVDLVIQYSSPRQVTRLLQRVGRSGHKIGERAKGVVIASDSEDILESLVIASKAKKESLEKVKIPENPCDVLAHQLVGLALDLGRVYKDDALEIVRRSFVFSNLSREEFEEVLELMASLRLLWLEDDVFGKTRASWKYYFENISTIPDARRYFVKNIVTQSKVGVLDEAFVVHHVAPGNLIIFKGSPWRVVALDEEEVTVEPVEDIVGAIPSWVGEEIPVPFEIAEKVGKTRGALAKNGSVLNGYSSDAYTKKLAGSKVRRHVRKGIPVPNEKYLLVELFENFVVIHAPFGTKVNQTVGRTFSTLLTARLGSSVALQSDAYRIILQTPEELREEDIKELFSIEPSLLEPLLSKSLKRTSLFKWKFLHVAKRFGAVSKDASYAHIHMGKIIANYEDTPIYQETLKEIFRDNLDLKKSKSMLRGIRKGTELHILELKKPSPLAELGLQAYGEVILPERAERMILKALKKRISNRRIELFCIYCAKGASSMRIKNIAEDATCPKCGARMLAVLKGRNKELKRLYRRFKAGKALGKEEKQELKRMQTAASLVLSYGKRAMVALAARGVGPEVAKRVLQARDEEGLYKAILKAERDYARTKRFWD
ncbi:MAG: DEAD/DEAH box helicase [Candidatus Hydrothermarchaeales archaeon]